MGGQAGRLTDQPEAGRADLYPTEIRSGQEPVVCREHPEHVYLVRHLPFPPADFCPLHAHRLLRFAFVPHRPHAALNAAVRVQFGARACLRTRTHNQSAKPRARILPSWALRAGSWRCLTQLSPWLPRGSLHRRLSSSSSAAATGGSGEGSTQLRL